VKGLVEITERLVESTKEIFSSMIMLEVDRCTDDGAALNPLLKSITGMVGLAGSHKGIVAIHFPDEVAMAITSSFLGMEVDQMNEDVQDAVGEVANMLAGDIKTILSDNGRDIQLSLPSTISGDQYIFQTKSETDRVLVPFSMPGGMFRVELELERL